MTSEERMLVINRLHELLRPFMLRRVKIEVMGQLPEKVRRLYDVYSTEKDGLLFRTYDRSGFGSSYPPPPPPAPLPLSPSKGVASDRKKWFVPHVFEYMPFYSVLFNASNKPNTT